jgi:catechol 2,3-dioxygenase-like lactoylglutathione lyase family enzyme
MSETKPLGSPARALLIRARDLENAKKFYTEGLGLSCAGETQAVSDGCRALWGLSEGEIRLARLTNPADAYGAIDLIEWSEGSEETIRDPQRPFDYGWLSINWRTSAMPRAIERLAAYGGRAVSTTKSYEAGGRLIHETMIDLPTGERCTLLQVGEARQTPHPFGEAAATIGVVVESVEKSLPFYRDLLGLRVALTINHTGEPFASLLGAPSETHLNMALLAGAGAWSGKLELLEFTLPESFNPRGDANLRADGRRNGYWMVSLSTPDCAAFAEAATKAGAVALRGPLAVERPFIGQTQAMIVRAPGGELFEVYEQE